jgi:hypothetical protein
MGAPTNSGLPTKSPSLCPIDRANMQTGQTNMQTREICPVPIFLSMDKIKTGTRNTQLSTIELQ